MKRSFEALTSHTNSRTTFRPILLPESDLQYAINIGKHANIPTQILDTWIEAHSVLYKPNNSLGARTDSLSYVDYVKKVYLKGHEIFKPGNDAREELKKAACYDTDMTMYVLNYVEMWPFLAGAPVTTTALRNIDREIFWLYGRWQTRASWTLSSPPPISDRGPAIKGILVRAGDDIDGIQVKYGSSWGVLQGNPRGGGEKRIEMGDKEYISSVIIHSGHKLGKLVCTTNLGNRLEQGAARHADEKYQAAPEGYQLTTVKITHWEGYIPTGCEGVLVGFRPLMMDASMS